jgi:hypothetical protein
MHTFLLVESRLPNFPAEIDCMVTCDVLLVTIHWPPFPVWIPPETHLIWWKILLGTKRTQIWVMWSYYRHLHAFMRQKQSHPLILYEQGIIYPFYKTYTFIIWYMQKWISFHLSISHSLGLHQAEPNALGRWCSWQMSWAISLGKGSSAL